MTGSTTKVFFTIAGAIFAVLALFFIYYTVRLIYINFTMADVAAHRTGGMLIGAIAFPLATIIFGLLCWLCFRKARKRTTTNE